MTSTPRPSTTARTVARPLLVVAALTVAAYVVWTVPGVRPRPGFDRWYDGALQGSGYVLVAAVAVLGAWNRGTGPASRWVAGAISLRAAGFVITLTGLALGHVPSYPSPADAAWVLSGLALFVALTLRLRALSPRVTGLAVLDGVAASLLALGLAIDVLDARCAP